MKAKSADIVAAIATPPGSGGVGVIRVSGPALGEFARGIAGKLPEPRRAILTRFFDARGEAIDQGLLLYFPAPHSYTGEDVLELQGHGGPVVMQMLLKRCLELGARLAEPGEFTKRAFLNEKLDLAQAESVADLIEAGSEAAARSAMRSLAGRFSSEIHAWLARLIELRMLAEATLDFPEEEVDFLVSTGARDKLAKLLAELEGLLARSQQGSLLRRGLHVVLAGQPNVGKSSLLNQLAGHERAIVTEIAGTTRDVLREYIQIEGIPLHVIDTAGLRDTSDQIERIGIQRSWAEIAGADVVLRLVDARHGITAEDHAIDSRLPGGVPVLWVFNKIDLAGQAPRAGEIEGGRGVWLSARSGDGIDTLRQALLEIAGWQTHGEDVVLARERHLDALQEARTHLLVASEGIAQLELFAEELRLTQICINRITGEFGADDLLGVIFSRFCIGK